MMDVSSQTFQFDAASVPNEIRHAFWYHGYARWVNVGPRLKKDGDYILVKDVVYGEGRIVYAVSVKWESIVHHFMVHQDQYGFSFDTHYEPTVYKLIWWHRRNKVPLTVASQVVLVRGMLRPNWFFKHNHIKLVEKVGEGSYGDVYEADSEYGTTVKGRGSKIRVVVKVLRKDFSIENCRRFNLDARLLRTCSHRHIVNLVGVAVHESPLMLVTEFCNGGTLQSYLRNNRGKIPVVSKVRLLVEAADALSHIHSHGFIHRDIAAHSCYIYIAEPRKVLKIGNFEMAHDQLLLHDSIFDKPSIRWMAPETLLEGIYSTKSDVWSYGILVWEIYADGAEPYPDMDNSQAREAILGEEHSLQMHEDWDCPRAVSEEVVNQCWKKDPDERPEMSTIYNFLRKL